MKPFKSAFWISKFVGSLILLLVLIPSVAELSFGALLYAAMPLTAANAEMHDRWLHENRAALPTCERYRADYPLPAGVSPLPAGFIPINQRGDWLCRPEGYR